MDATPTQTAGLRRNSRQAAILERHRRLAAFGIRPFLYPADLLGTDMAWLYQAEQKTCAEQVELIFEKGGLTRGKGP